MSDGGHQSRIPSGISFARLRTPRSWSCLTAPSLRPRQRILDDREFADELGTDEEIIRAQVDMEWSDVEAAKRRGEAERARRRAEREEQLARKK